MDADDGKDKMLVIAPVNQGPFVRAALLCERVLCETDGTLSAIRILHEGVVSGPGGAASGLVLLLMLVRGDVSPGQHRASLEIQGPSGEIIGHKDVLLALDDGGAEQASSLVLDVSFEPRVAGVYWFRVSWGEEARLLTRVPFTAHAISRVEHAGLTGEGAHASR